MKRQRNPERELRLELEATKALLAALEAEGVDAAEADLIRDMVEGETNLFEAIDGVIDRIDAAESAIDGIKLREEIYANRRRALVARIERLRALLEQTLVIAELKTVQRPAATLTLSRVAPKLVVEEESRVPARFFRQPPLPDPVIDRAALKAALDAGETIEGARLTQGGVSLGIRR